MMEQMISNLPTNVESTFLKLEPASLWDVDITRKYTLSLRAIEDYPVRKFICEKIAKLAKGEWPAAFIKQLNKTDQASQVFPYKVGDYTTIWTVGLRVYETRYVQIIRFWDLVLVFLNFYSIFI